jgi:succinate dehydrogenase / fumarate reductase, flavoprotein subunit
MKLDANIPGGPVQIVVGTGLAGASAAASLAELGYNVKAFCIQDSARRAHSIAAQGGINAAKNYPNDGDSVWRLFYDTVKGGDYRAREANVYRLAGEQQYHRPVRGPGRSVRPRIRRTAFQPLLRRRPALQNILCARSDRPAAAARCLQRPVAEVNSGKIEMFTREEMLDLV